MASNPAATLSALLSSTSIEDHEEVLKATNAILKTSKGDQNALYTRVIALLKLDRYEDALRALDSGGDKLAERCQFEKAYALYKTGQLEEARRIFMSTSSPNRGIRHVAAQVAYRAEQFEQAGLIYQELSGQGAAIEDEENDLRINTLAVDVQLEWQGNGDKVAPSRKKPVREDMEAFETAYNAACGSIARGELAQGSVLLKRARDLCESLDELTDDEKRAEILPIMVQQAYVFAKLGKLSEAETIQNMIDISDIPEPPTRVVGQNNALASANTNENPYLTERIFDSMPTLSKTEKLFEHQENILRKNRYVIDLQTNKHEGVTRSTSKFLSQKQLPTTSTFINIISAIGAAAVAHSDNIKSAIKKLLPLLEKRQNDVGLVLTVVQLYISVNNHAQAISVLEAFLEKLEASHSPEDLDVRFTPGLVALIVSLYRTKGRKVPMKTELAKAASHWKQKSAPAEELLKAAGLSLLESSKADDLAAAGELFGSLRKQDPESRLAIAGLVASHATTNISLVKSDLEKLTPVDRMVADIDTAALEAGGVASLPITMSDASKKRAAPAEKEKPAKKRARKSKLPKDYVEGKQMDPERWLPLKDRSTYRPKGKKGKKKAMDSTQGGVVKDEEGLELTAGSGVVRVEKAGGGGKAKKKKGKK